MEPEAFEERAAAWRSLDKALIACEATPMGALLRYRLEAGMGEVLLELSEAERKCCPSLSFRATVDVSIDAPEEARLWIRQTFLAEGPTARPVEAGHAGRVQEAVGRCYASAAAQLAACGEEWPGRCQDQVTGIGQSAYASAELEGLPAPAVAGSIGCANPLAVTELHSGETVLDLGSGCGLDVLLSARRVAPTGKAYGLDMTDEMLDLARANKAAAGVSNAEFLKGHMEAIPLPANSVDVVVSNCVISLSVEKDAVFAEAHRCCDPGPAWPSRTSWLMWSPPPSSGPTWTPGSRARPGALTREQYGAALERAGFADVSLQDSHPVADSFTSVIVTATRPTAA